MLFYASALFQQFIVDAWAQLEQSHLNYIKYNQQKFRIERASGIVDALPNEGQNNPQDIGQPIYLPSSFIGGARNMFQLLWLFPASTSELTTSSL